MIDSVNKIIQKHKVKNRLKARINQNGEFDSELSNFSISSNHALRGRLSLLFR